LALTLTAAHSVKLTFHGADTDTDTDSPNTASLTSDTRPARILERKSDVRIYRRVSGESESVSVGVGAVECELNRVTLTVDFLTSTHAEQLPWTLDCIFAKFGADGSSRFAFRERTRKHAESQTPPSMHASATAVVGNDVIAYSRQNKCNFQLISLNRLTHMNVLYQFQLIRDLFTAMTSINKQDGMGWDGMGLVCAAIRCCVHEYSYV